MSGEGDAKTHSQYTEIPLRSFEAMTFEGNLSEVLLALIVDPLEAVDVARTILDIYPTEIELSLNGNVVDASIALSDFVNLPSKHAFEQLKITLAQWVMTTKQADDALKTLTEWDGRFGVWCACAVAREAIRSIPKDELRPLRAIKAAEAWVSGKSSVRRARNAAAAAEAAAEEAAAYADEAADDASNAIYNIRAAYDVRAASDAAYAASYVARAAYTAAAHATDAAIHTAGVACGAARVAAQCDAAYVAAAFADVSLWTSARDAELVRLREVVANACLTFPG
jgi:hypothetical protein